MVLLLRWTIGVPQGVSACRAHSRTEAGGDGVQGACSASGLRRVTTTLRLLS